MADRGIAVVTGGGGFIGSRLSAALAAQGRDVRRLDVRPADGVTVADVTDAGDLDRAFAGADVVFHTAALVGEKGSPDAFWRLNVQAVRTVLDAAARAGVRRVVHFSSKVVYGDRIPSLADLPGGVDETWPVRPTASPYTYTKVAAEHLALMAHAAGDVRVSIVRPGDVYGPASAQWTVRPVAMLKRRMLALPRNGEGVVAATYVDDLVDAVVAIGEHPDAAGQVFNVNGGQPILARDFFGYYARELGRGLPHVPHRVVATVGAAGSAAQRVGLDPPFSRNTIEYVSHPGTYSIGKIERLTGWRPQVDIDEGMRRTVAWLRNEGML